MAPTRIAQRQLSTQPLSSFQSIWSSGDLAWAEGTAQTVNHTLGRHPFLIRCSYVCVTAHSYGGVSFSVGDRIDSGLYVDSAGILNGIAIQRIGSSQIRLVPYRIGVGLGNATNANWRIRIDLW